MWPSTTKWIIMCQMAIFMYLYLLKVNSLLFTTVKLIFKSEDQWPSYILLNMVVRHSAFLRKLALNVEDFYVKTIGWGLKNHVFDHETWKSGLFSCYKLKINDFLSSYNQNLKIDIFTPLQQIPCFCKSRLGTLRLILWWRVTYFRNRMCIPVKPKVESLFFWKLLLH